MYLERLITQLVHKARSIRLTVTKLHELRYPTDSPLYLAKVISEISQVVEDEILNQYWTGPKSLEDFIVRVKLAIIAIRGLGAHLRFIERATTDQTPWSLIRPLEKIGEQIHPTSCFIIRPQWRYNYSLLELISAYSEAFSELLSKEKLNKALYPDNSIQQIYVMGFPNMDRLSVMMYVLFGHELGHPIEKEYFDRENKNSAEFAPKLTHMVLEALDLLKELKSLKLEQGAKYYRMITEVHRLRHQALRELICDLVCINLFGPAALFANEEYALSAGLDSVEKKPPHYPPWRYRLRTMLEEFPSDWIKHFIEKGRFNKTISKALNNKMESIRIAVEQSEDKKKLNEDAETRIAYTSLEDALPKVRQFVRQRLKKYGFQLDDLLGATNVQLLKRLENWIPPDAYINNEGDEVIGDVRSVLNVGWLQWVSAYASMPTTTDVKDQISDYFNKVDALNRLVMKAIENINLRSEWKKYELTKKEKNYVGISTQ